MKTFNQIKKHSESYAKMMRDFFPLSFENEELNDTLSSIVFDDEKTLFVEELQKQNKLQAFKSYIYSLINVEKGSDSKNKEKSVVELLDSV